MLLVLFVTALSAAPELPAESVRSAVRPGTVRPDTTLPTPAIVAPRQPAPEVVLPIRPVTSIGQPSAPPVLQAPARPMTGETAKRSTVGVQQSASLVHAGAAPKPSAASTEVATSGAVEAMAKPLAMPAPAAAPPARADAKEAIVATATSSAAAAPANNAPTARTPVVAPADAVAKAAAPGAGTPTTTRVDPRTVVSVKSSESFEPLYAVPIPAAGIRIPRPTAADSIVVYKRERTLILYHRGVPVKSYFIALGSQPVGDKQRKGDQRTPEGLFYINAHNPASKFHLALRISYPSDAHRARAAALGVDPGGDIMIHGLPKDFSEAGKAQSQNDWTNGCVAVSNQEIEEIWQAVPDGTPVQIKP
jgi:lipoprotein-anchoring transpeptidase ErfK/SrfK